LGLETDAELAKAALRADAGLLFEDGTLQFAVIEEVLPGLVGVFHPAWWFHGEHLGDDVYEISALATPPAFAVGTVSFAMG
jgi:hypothetical protein